MSFENSTITTQPGSEARPIYSDTPKYGDYEPTGLKDLAKTNLLTVHQFLDVVEVLLGWERSNRYQVCDKDGKQIFFVYESGICYLRKILGSSRGIVMRATDNDSQDVLSLERPLRCSTRCLWMCCHLQEMTVFSPPGTAIATVKEIWSACTPLFHVYNTAGELHYVMEGDCCHCRACADMTFQVCESSGHKEVVAVLTKHRGGTCREIIGASNEFSVKYVKEMEVKEKLIILGAVYLIDFNYFETHCRC